MQKFLQYLKDVRSELAKVSWPSRAEVTSATTLVVILSIAVALCVKAFDVILNGALGYVLNL
jgi:preprotein translocase subunit SecE